MYKTREGNVYLYCLCTSIYSELESGPIVDVLGVLQIKSA